MVDALYILRNTGLCEHIQTSYHGVQSSSQISPNLFYNYAFISPICTPTMLNSSTLNGHALLL